MKIQSVPSAQKVMLSIFWEPKRVFVPNICRRDQRYCKNLLSLKKCCLHYSNARQHCSNEMMKIVSLKFTVVSHFRLFSMLKELLKGQHFSSGTEVQAAVCNWINSKQVFSLTEWRIRFNVSRNAFHRMAIMWKKNYVQLNYHQWEKLRYLTLHSNTSKYAHRLNKYNYI